MGTTQLLSVPYALYANSAGSVQSQGKTAIYLTGDITNAQAAAKIAAELGTNTENIYIRNTTQLTTVDLSALETIGNIEIFNNPNLTNVILNNLTRIENDFVVWRWLPDLSDRITDLESEIEFRAGVGLGGVLEVDLGLI